ncbi:MAG TPA: DNA primase [Flavobacterium sp.]|jgi:hypothetical protein
MKRIIVDYSKLTNEILNLLVEKFPDGYDDSNIIRFKNHKNETIEAVEVRTEDTIFLVKISTKLSDRIINFDEDEDIVVPIEDAIKDLDLDDEDVAADDEEDEKEDKPEFDDEDEDADPSDIADDEDEDDEI